MIPLIIVGIIALCAIAGMFYWMHKSRNGTLNLKQDAWHMKLLHWMWDIEPKDAQNACPYYWSIVCSLLLLPVYVVIKYVIYIPSMFISAHWPKWLKFKRRKINITVPNWLKSEKWNQHWKMDDYVPSDLRDLYKFLYRYGKAGLLILFNIVWVCLIVFLAIFFLVYPFFKFSIIWAFVIEGTILYILATILVCIIKPEWDKHHWDHWKNLGIALYGIVMIPFRVIWGIISSLFSFMFQVVEDNCPPINWVE